MNQKGFKNLKVWKEGKDLAIEIYKITNTGKFLRDRSLTEHLRRTAVSIPSNIAEGDERGSNRDSARFLYIAKGSLAELRTQLEISTEIGYIDKLDFEKIDKECMDLGIKLGKLIKVRLSSPTPNP